MLNQIAVEALYSATYVENYLDAVENLPDEIQRYITRIREIDVKHRSYLRDVDIFYEQWANCSTNELESTNATKRNRAMTRIQQSLIAAQELGDEKLQIVQQLTDLIESKTRQLDQNFKNLDYGKDEPMNIDVTTALKERRSQSPSSPVAATSAQPFVPVPTAVAPVPAAVNVSSNSTAASTNSQAGTSSNGNADRSNKRARRQARQDTGSGMDVDGSDSNTKPEPIVPAKSVSATQTASNTSQKKAVAAKQTTNNNKKKRTSKTGTSGTSSGRQSASGHNSSRDAREDTPPQEETIDPDEPTYCLCDQISFGEMILCDNDLCPIEWFHFSCVGLATKPKGRWYCPNCRGDRPNVMKPKAQFLKELERYNKEKEEKT